MPVLVLDPMLEEQIRTERDNPQIGKYDEVWEGVLVVSPTPNNEHQVILADLTAILLGVIDREKGDRVFPGCNVSDRDAGWMTNFREPDIAVYLAGNPAKDCDSHWMGGPDLAVEIVSPGEDPREKLSFYAKVKTRELLIVDRKPWKLEMYTLRKGKLVSTGMSHVVKAKVLASSVLPLTFQLRAGKPRPTIAVAHTETKQTWTV